MSVEAVAARLERLTREQAHEEWARQMARSKGLKEPMLSVVLDYNARLTTRLRERHVFAEESD